MVLVEVPLYLWVNGGEVKGCLELRLVDIEVVAGMDGVGGEEATKA